MKHNYSNPRFGARIDNWPLGGNKRGVAEFVITIGRAGQQRAERTTTNPLTGKVSAPKVTTYALQARIVDGDDGRTYILNDHGSHFSIYQGNLQYQEETVFPGQEGYEALRQLIEWDKLVKETDEILAELDAEDAARDQKA